MGLLPLEFSDCLLDSPYFRENLRAHEKQLDQTATDIKGIISNIQDVLDAARQLSKAKRALSTSLTSFQFDCIGTSLTDDEVIIANSLKQFSNFLSNVDDELDRLLERAHEKFISPLANFRKEQIGAVKKTKKEFDKVTARFCTAQDRYVNLSSKKEESLAEAAEAVRFERRNLNESSLEYVYLMHVVQEKKKFEFVEALLCFMRSWANYYRHGHVVSQDSASYMNDLQSRIQKTRDNFSAICEQYEQLKQKMLTGHQDPGLFNKMYTRQGYLYVQNKKNLIGSQWSKHYCQYQARSHNLTMIPYSQLQGKITTTESIKVTSCLCKEESNEKFRFVVTGEDTNNPGTMVTHTLQAMSEYERKHWVESMGGTWPAISTLQRIRADSVEDNLNSMAFAFLKDCLAELETRGLTDQGLYRVGGVLSKVKKLLNRGLDPQPGEEPLDLSDPKMWESKTIASAVKQYFRDLSKPLLTHHLYNEFVVAVKHDSEPVRVQELQKVVRKLPVASREILKVLIKHLNKVASKSDHNLMTAANIGVCFGPTLLRPREETVATIMDIKFCNEVVQILIEHCDKFFAMNSSIESSPEVMRTSPEMVGMSEVDGREQRGSSTPKRTHSFSSFSQLSTNSLPDIKELKESKLSVASATNAAAQIFGRATTDRIRSRSIQHSPIVITGPSVAVRPKNLFKSSTQDDLMASLEFMNSLAADLPSNGHGNINNSNIVNVNNNNKSNNSSGPLWLTATSPLKRSHTVQARRVVKIGNGNVTVVKPQLHLQQQFLQQQHQQQQQQSEVMRKPPLPKLSLASPTSTQQSFAMSIPVQQQQQQQQYQPSHYSGLPHITSGGSFYRSNGNFVHTGLTPIVKAILSPSVCEQPHWPQQQQQQQHQIYQSQLQQQPQESYNYGNPYQQASSPRLSRPTELFVRDIPLIEPRVAHRAPDEPPIPQRASSEGPACSDTPPPLPARKFRRLYTSGDVVQKDQREFLTRNETSKPSSTTQTSPRLYRTALSIDSGVMMGSPSPPTDSGIGVSPPTQVRQIQQQKTRISLKANNEDSSVEITTTLVLPKVEEQRRQRNVVSSDDSASICSSALSVESDTSGSRYDNVATQKLTPASSDDKTSKTTSLVKAAADIAETRFLTSGHVVPQSRGEDGDDENDDDTDDEDGDYDSDHIDIESSASSSEESEQGPIL